MRSRLVVTGLTGYFALCALSALAPSLAQEREHGADHESEVAQLFRSQCISCHVVPEPGLATDRAWIRQLQDTAWSSTPPRAREALRRYLSSPAVADLRPRVVEEETPTGDAQAAVSLPWAGEVFLQGPQRQIARLRWEEGEEGQTRPLPAGRYQLRGYRVVSGEWILSASGGETPLRLPAEPHELQITPTAELLLSAVRHKQRVTVRASLGGYERMGLSLYHEGTRIPLPFVVENAQGETVAEGSLSYGWGGGAGGSVNLPQGKPLTVRLLLPDGIPFEIQGARERSVPR